MTPKPSTATKLLWFAALWAAGVLAVAVLGLVIKWAIGA